MPRFEIEAHREGLIVGSACSEGELFDAVLHEESEERLEEIASFYDYLEIQPLENNMYLVRDGMVESLDSIKNINRHIIALGDKLGKMTAADLRRTLSESRGCGVQKRYDGGAGLPGCGQSAPSLS